MNLTIDGAAVHFRAKRGTSHTLLFVHGAGMDQRVWTPVAALAEKLGYGTIKIDLPGHGQSDGAPLARISQIGHWLAACANAIDVKELVLVGHSMGAIAALAAATDKNISLAGLVLCGIAERLSVHPDLLQSAKTDRQQAEALIAKWSVAPTSSVGPLDSYFSSQKDGVLATDLKACDDYEDALNVISKISCPTLFLLGAEDKMTPPQGATPLISACKNSHSVELEACGHMMHLEKPLGVVTAIDTFLKH